MDSNVLAVQQYLNAICSGSPDWVPLEENGQTGTTTMQGIIRAFQIENGVPNPTGNLGPNTISKMKSLSPISKMDPNDTPRVNVCLIQCALFCKGYAAGGITGIYYNNGVNAVKAMQEHAGLPVTGIIDWKVWAGLLSLNWFQLAEDGDEKIRQMQQQLNSDYSDVIGVCACDGRKNRVTASSLLVALQAELGVETDYIYDLSAQAFGPATTSAFKNKVGILKSGRNDESIKPYNRIVQYALYYYGFDQTLFGGLFGSEMESVVEEFQLTHILTNIGLEEEVGQVGVSTMKSLLVSCGDPDRKAIACDTSTCLNSQQINDLKNAGYQIVGRYLTGTVGWSDTLRSKALTVSEINEITSAGMKIFPIYQDGGTYLEYFQRYEQGFYDAITAIEAAKRLGFSTGTYIYFAVDFDCLEYQAVDYVLPYFKQIYSVFSSDINTKNYKVGVYAPRLICTLVQNEGYAERSFVSDMSTGFSGNLGQKFPEKCAFDQFAEVTFSSSPNFNIDKVAFSGWDPGRSSFDPIIETETQIVDRAYQDFGRKFLKSINLFESKLGFTFDFNKGGEVHLGTIISSSNYMSLKLQYGQEFDSNEGASLLTVGFDQDGNLSTEFLNALELSLEKLTESDDKNKMNSLLRNMAVCIGFGTISLKFTKTSDYSYRAEIMVYTDDLMPEYTSSYKAYCKLIIDVTITDSYDDEHPFNGFDPVKVASATLSTLNAVVLSTLSSVVDYLPRIGDDEFVLTIAEIVFLSIFYGAIIYLAFS